MGEKKVVGRTVAIALGMVCIFLLVGLIVATVVIVNYTSIVSDKDATISAKDSQINSLNEQVQNVQNLRDFYAEILDLKLSEIWIKNQTVSQPANAYSHWTILTNYAGYVRVDVNSSTTDSTYVEVIYSSHGVDFDGKMVVGLGGTASFPIIPADWSIEVRVGNASLPSGATETVTITVYY